MIDRAAHWEDVYSSKGEREVSWFEESPALSLSLIEALVPASAAVVDVCFGVQV